MIKQVEYVEEQTRLQYDTIIRVGPI